MLLTRPTRWNAKMRMLFDWTALPAVADGAYWISSSPQRTMERIGRACPRSARWNVLDELALAVVDGVLNRLSRPARELTRAVFQLAACEHLIRNANDLEALNDAGLV